MKKTSQPSKIICPKCGFEQSASNKCVKCGIIFSKYNDIEKEERTEKKPNTILDAGEKDKNAIVIFQCKHCKKRYRIKRELIPPKKFVIRCKQCGEKIFLSGEIRSSPIVQKTELPTKQQTEHETLNNFECPNCNYSSSNFFEKCPQCGHMVKGRQEVNKAPDFPDYDGYKRNIRTRQFKLVLYSQLIGFISYFIGDQINSDSGFIFFLISIFVVSVFIIYKTFRNLDIAIRKYLSLTFFFVFIAFATPLSVYLFVRYQEVNEVVAVMAIVDMLFFILLFLGAIPKFIFPSIKKVIEKSKSEHSNIFNNFLDELHNLWEKHLKATDPHPKPPKEKEKSILKVLSDMINEFKQIDFIPEIIKFYENNTIYKFSKNIALLSILVCVLIPLLISTFGNKSLELIAFSVFFAILWGIIFKKYILKYEGSIKLPVLSIFFTGIVGMYALILFYNIFVPDALLHFTESKNSVVSLFGYIFQVGIFEELCKIAPVIIYIKYKKQKVNTELIILIGVFSGLGFAATENISYNNIAILNSLGLTLNYGGLGFKEGIQDTIVQVLIRSISLTFFHAVLSGIFSYFLAKSYIRKRPYRPFFILGLLVSAVLHGVYDWLPMIFALFIVGFSFILFYGYIRNLKTLISMNFEKGS